MKSRLTDYSLWPWLFAVLLQSAVATAPVHASGFEAMVSPPRFELQSDPGETLRQIVTIQNAGDRPASFAVRTADWDLSADGGLTIHPPELQPGSCRPWARIERRSLRLPAQGLEDAGVAVALVDGAVGGEEIHEAVALDVLDPDALGLLDDDVQRVVVVGAVALGLLRTIGDPNVRFREDPVRILRVRRIESAD